SGISVDFDRRRRARRDDRDSATRALTSRRHLGIPILDLSLRFFAGDAVALLDPANQLLSTALDLIDVVIGQLAPALAHFPLELQPLAFENVFVHVCLLQGGHSTACRSLTSAPLKNSVLGHDNQRGVWVSVAEERTCSQCAQRVSKPGTRSLRPRQTTMKKSG